MHDIAKSPAAWADADRARKIVCVLPAINPDHISPSPETQQFRSAWLSRRYRISSPLAATIALLCFGEGAR